MNHHQTLPMRRFDASATVSPDSDPRANGRELGPRTPAARDCAAILRVVGEDVHAKLAGI